MRAFKEEPMRFRGISVFTLLVLAVVLAAYPTSKAVAEKPADPGSIPGGWLDRASEEIRQSEYHFSADRDGAQSAPNREHALRSRISLLGLHVEPRTEPLIWRLDLRIEGHGRGLDLTLDDAVGPQAIGNRVEILRKGLTEWYVNDERGLEQGFTLSEPPQGRATGRAVRFVLALDTDLSPVLAPDRRAVTFRDGTGKEVLVYGSLRVVDALGTDLKAEMALEPGRLLLRYDDRDARYPVTIDPLLTSPSWSVEMNVSGAAQLGISVATAGDVNNDGLSDVILGANGFDNNGNDRGKVLLYLGTAGAAGLQASPSWTQEGSLAGARFGAAVSTAGDVNGDGYADLIVAEPNYHGTFDQQGRVHVYLGNSSGQSLVEGWQANGDEDFGHFGASVAFAGDINHDGYADVLIGMPDSSAGGFSGNGRAFAWYGSASGLGASGTPSNAAWTAMGDQGGTKFGAAVAMAGDVNADTYDDIIVGAPLHDNNSGLHVDGGKAYVYLGSSSGIAASPVWSADPDQASAQFGNAVATAGDVNGDGYADVIVGAFMGSEPTFTSSGKAFVYHGSSSGPVVLPPGSASWLAAGGQNNARLGSSVGTAGDVNGDGYADIIVGAKTYTNGQTSEGRAFAWYGGAGGLGANGTPANADWSAENNVSNADFGASVATAGDVNGDGFSDVLVGSPLFESTGGQADEGKVFLYRGSGDGLSTSIRWTGTGTASGSEFATSVASAGDVNGDGYSDVAIGAPEYDGGQTNEGKVFVFHGSSNGLPASASWSAESNLAGAKLGFSVARAGDVNGDGYGDLIVGAPFHTSNEGRALVYHGSSTGLGSNPAATLTSTVCCGTGGNFGTSVASAGDVDRDGFADVIVGAPHKVHSVGTNEGEADIFLGSVNGLATTPVWSVGGGHADGGPGDKGDEFGISVASAGDVNRDGYSDVIVGAHFYDNDSGHNNDGWAFVFHGGSGGPDATADWTGRSSQGNSDFGFSVASAGDVNGDGYSDVIIGAPLLDNGGGQADEGHAFVWLGSASGVTPNPGTAAGGSTNAAWRTESNVGGAHYGASVGTAGDINNDGYSDVVVGAPLLDNPEVDEGRVSVFLSVGGTLSTTPVTIESNTASAKLGSSVALAGDVNGDGFSDLVFGAPGISSGLGQAYLYSGSAGLGRVPRQARTTGGLPIDLLLKTYDPGTSYRIRLVARTPAGRGVVAIQWENRDLATAFSGSGLGQGSFVDSGTPLVPGGSSVVLEGTQGSLTLGTSYRWRARSITKSPFFPRSPWFTLPYNNLTEKDLIALAGSPPPPPPPCGPCLVSWCTGAGFKCEWTDTCGAGGCCIYDCNVPDPTCQGADLCPDDPPPCNCSGGQ
jgi:hypothetical protein